MEGDHAAGKTHWILILKKKCSGSVKVNPVLILILFLLLEHKNCQATVQRRAELQTDPGGWRCAKAN